MDSTLNATIFSGLRSKILSANSFRLSVLAATMLPIFIALGLQASPLMRVFPSIVSALYSSSLTAVFTIMGTISAAHVCSTAYLLFNPKEYIGVKNARLVLVLLPIGLLTATFIVLLVTPLWAAMIFMLIYIHYGMWHFGRQNLGVLSFVSRISRAKPMSDFERKTIMAGVLAGMSAAYSLFAPALMLNQKAFPFDVTDINSFFSSLWYIGAAINVILVPLTLWYV